MRINKGISARDRKRFAIVVDGECEFWYINMLKRNNGAISVNLEPQIPQRKKLSDQYSNVISLSKDYHKVFWIIDFDVINSETIKAKAGAKTALQEFKEYYLIIKNNHKNIKVIINNPCLEFWLLLHYESTSKYFDRCDNALNQLKKHLAGYEKTHKFYTKQGNDIYLILNPLLNTAIKNAKNFNDFDFNNPHSGLSQMHLLFEEIK